MREEQSLIEHIKRHGKIAAPEEMSAQYRGEIVRVMSVLVDSWLAAAAGFADIVNRAPGLQERQTMLRITFVYRDGEKRRKWRPARKPGEDKPQRRPPPLPVEQASLTAPGGSPGSR